MNPYNEILAKQISMVDKNMNETNEDEMSKKWIGSTERYSFIEEGDKTKLEIEIATDEAFEKMFNTGWQKALKIIKSLCEK